MLLAGCPPPEHPHVAPAAAQTIDLTRPGTTLHGVAGDGDRVYAALDHGGHKSSIEARRGAQVTWTAALDGDVGPLAHAAGTIVAAVAVPPGGAIRGEPGAIAVALDAATGAVKWRVAIDSSRWSAITSLAAAPDGGVLVGGSFAGTLRAGSHVVSSAGESDGFVARLSPAGQVAWLVRLGGSYADAVQGVAGAGDGVVIAGTFTSHADIEGHALEPIDEKLATADAFVAMLDATGAVKWSHAFGGKDDDSVAGVAVDERGRIAVAATVRDAVVVGSVTLTTRGAADGLVVWYGATGDLGATAQLGGTDFDGLRAIASAGDGVVVGGFFSGKIQLGARALAAGGGDDSFVAAIKPDGSVAQSWQVGGDGREEITALAALPGGFVAGVAHTAAAAIDDQKLPSPADPMTGAALIVRGVP